MRCAGADRRLTEAALSERCGPAELAKLEVGLIDYNGHIEVHNSLLSAVLHDKPQLKIG